jgi:integrase
MAGRQEMLRWGRVQPREGTPPYVVLDQSGNDIAPITAYLRDRALSDASPLTCRSYAHDLLRWFRVLWYLNTRWDRAVEADVAALVGWFRRADNPQRRRTRSDAPSAGEVNPLTGKAEPRLGYAPATINHALTVISGFYEYHLHFGRGPLLNPVPASKARRLALAHRSPLEPAARHTRARLRSKITGRQPRSIPDAMFEQLFTQMNNDRDRALLAFYVSSGARASELLTLRMDDVDWGQQRIWVISKGSRDRQAVPASPESFTYLGRYLDADGLPLAGQPIWRTRRGKQRPLSYWAMRQVIERANQHLGTNWTLHDLRHTAATRLASDPDITLPEVQTIMRHAHLSTTQRYTVPRIEDLAEKLAAHYTRPVAEPRWSPMYDPNDMRTVFGE